MAENFIDDDLDIPVKVDAISIPSGADEENYVNDTYLNLLRQAAYDLRTRAVEHATLIETIEADITSLESLITSINSTNNAQQISINSTAVEIAIVNSSLDARITALEEAPGGGGESLWSEADSSTATMADYSNTLSDTLPGADRDDPSGLTIWRNSELTDDPRFADGNPYVAGIGLEAKGTYYRDDTTDGWQLIWSIERSGTAAAVHDGVRRPSLEGYIQNGDEKPWFRIDSSAQGIQFGSGGHVAAAGQATRSGTTLTVTTGTEHKFGVGQLLYKQTIGGAAEYGSDGEWLEVASVVDSDTFTVTVPNSGITSNTLPISFSAESAIDVVFARGSYGVAEIRVANTSDDDVETIYQGSRLRHQWYIGGSLKAYIDSDGFHYTPTYWSNDGGETQTGQDTFYVNGATTTLTDIATAGGTGSRRRIWNTRASGSVTVSPSGGNTINGTSSYVIANPGEGVDVDARGTNWLCSKLVP